MCEGKITEMDNELIANVVRSLQKDSPDGSSSVLKNKNDTSEALEQLHESFAYYIKHSCPPFKHLLQFVSHITYMSSAKICSAYFTEDSVLNGKRKPKDRSDIRRRKFIPSIVPTLLLSPMENR